MRFRTFFLVFLLAELVSYAAYFFPTLNAVGFFVLIVASLVLSLRRLEYGLGFVLADLILGGKSGLLFSFEYSGFILSLRMALFIIVMGVWAGKVVSECKIKNVKYKIFPGHPLLRWWGLLGVAVGWGMVVGLVRGNDFGNLFLDANGYFYAALMLPALWTIRNGCHSERSRSEVKNPVHDSTGSFAGAQDDMLRSIFLAATTLLALKTLFAVYWFTHAGNIFIGANLIPFYRWVRDTGIGEITTLPGNFARVFFQSHIYNVAAFFALLATVTFHNSPQPSLILREGDDSIPPLKIRGVRGVMRLRRGVLALNTSVIIVSLSRSFWVGVVVGLIVFTFVLIRSHNPSSPPLILRGGITLVGAIIGALAILLIVARFPFPRPSPASFSAAAQSRLKAGDAGQSRWNLLPPLFSAASGHPIVGHGFGKTITYISNDPRIREVSRIGEYTTSAFEWGWLDLWLKMGILGIITYAGLLIAPARQAIRLHLPFVVATIVALAAIHVFTPYLNHPLGLGILIIMSVVTLIARKSPAEV